MSEQSKTSKQTEKSALQEVKETIVDDEQPVDKKAPGSAFSLVAFSYLVVLAVAALAFAILFWFFGAFE